MGRTASRPEHLLLILVGTALLWLGSCTDAGTWDLLRREQEAPVWAASMKIDIDATAIERLLADVPVLIRLDQSNFDYSVSRQAGRDIGFYPEPFELGMEPLDHALVHWDPSGQSYFWIRVPLIPAGSTTSVYMHVGNEIATVPQNSAGVWRNGYAGVYLFDDSTGRYRDSTRFANDGQVNVNQQTEPTIVPGVIGSAIETARETDAVVIPDSETLRTLAPFTISFWVNLSPSFPAGRLFDKGVRYLNANDSGGQRRFQARIQHFTVSGADDESQNDVFRDWTATGPVADEWKNVTLRWDGRVNSFAMGLLVDGAEATNVSGQSADGTLISDAGTPLVVGNSSFPGGTLNFGGLIDQVEVSFVDRSQSWIAFHIATVEQTNMTYGELVRR